MDNLGLTDHCHTLNEVSVPNEMYALTDIPNNAAANCRREKGAEAVGAGAAMIRRVVVSR
jgi:hypothetical protein